MSQKKREVFEACDSLIKEGKKLREITIENLAIRLRELGYLRGSNTALSRYRKDWMERQGFQDEDKDKNLMGVKETSDGVLQAAERLRQSVIEEVRKEYEDRFQALLDTQTANEAEKAELQEMLTGLTEQNTKMEAQLTQTIDALKEKSHTLEKNEKSLAEANTRLEVQTELFEKCESDWQRERVHLYETHTSELYRLSEELRMQREQHNQAIQMLMDNNESQRHQWLNEKDEVKTEHQKTQKTVDTLKEQLTTIKTHYQQKTEQCENLETQYQQVLHQIDDLQAHCQAYGERIAALTVENHQRQENQAAVQRDYHAEMTQLKQIIGTLQDTLTRVENATKHHDNP